MQDTIDYFDSESFDMFLKLLEKLLRNNPKGIKEYDLMLTLKSVEIFNPCKEVRGSSLDLYRQHFFLFHSLYVLRDKLLLDKTDDICISTLSIKLMPYSQGSQALGAVDNLREYYLDREHLRNSSEATVNEMLNSFWELYLRNDKRVEALTILGLEDPVDDEIIIAEYRRQAMSHHPDRGGDSEKFKAINEAYGLLIE